MAITISAKVDNIQSTSQTFSLQAGSFLTKIKGKQVSTGDVEFQHRAIFQVFQRSMQEISELKKEIASKMIPSNEEQMVSFIERVTSLETDVLEGLNRLNDTLLTYYPTAKIFYGDMPCIGPKTSPVIHTSNKKILEMLSTASSIREIRGDGNCFISAFTTKFFENLVEEKTIPKFIEFIAHDGSDAYELKTELIETLLYLQEYPSQFENTLKNNQKVLPFVGYFRQLAAQEMEENKDAYEVFFLSEIKQIYGESTENQSYDQLLDKYVRAMGVDFSHPMITALCKKLDFPIRIIDPKIGALEGVLILDKPEINGTFCRNDQHYFVLYTSEQVKSIPQKTEALPSQSQGPQSPEIVVAQIPPIPTSSITIKYPNDGNKLFIRGNGPGMNWEKGIELLYLDNDTWTFLTQTSFQQFEYKILINDKRWENTLDHKLEFGKKEERTNLEFHPFPYQSQESQFPETPPIPTSCITIKYPNNGDKLFIRGNGPGMNWEKGIELLYLGNDTWTFSTQASFEQFEYKILINDKRWENTLDHKLEFGKKEERTNLEFQ